MLQIETFDARAGGNVIYKALAHPLAAERIADLSSRLLAPLAIYDADNLAEPLFALHPSVPRPASLFVHDTSLIGRPRAGAEACPITELPRSGARTVLIAAFDAGRAAARINHLLPPGAELLTLDEIRLPPGLLTNRARYLDKLNFATNFAFFREPGWTFHPPDLRQLLGRLRRSRDPHVVAPVRRGWRGTGYLGTGDPARTQLVFRSIAARCAPASICPNSPASCSFTWWAAPGTMWSNT